MPETKFLPPSLEQVEIENDRLRTTIEKIERLLVSEPTDLQRAIKICRGALNI